MDFAQIWQESIRLRSVANSPESTDDVSETACEQLYALDQEILASHAKTMNDVLAALNIVRFEFQTFFDNGDTGSAVILASLDAALGLLRRE